MHLLTSVINIFKNKFNLSALFKIFYCVFGKILNYNVGQFVLIMKFFKLEDSKSQKTIYNKCFGVGGIHHTH